MNACNYQLWHDVQASVVGIPWPFGLFIVDVVWFALFCCCWMSRKQVVFNFGNALRILYVHYVVFIAHLYAHWICFVSVERNEDSPADHPPQSPTPIHSGHNSFRRWEHHIAMKRAAVCLQAKEAHCVIEFYVAGPISCVMHLLLDCIW